MAPFPTHEEVVMQWSSMFNNTATFWNYVSLLEKCCFPVFPHYLEDPLAPNTSRRASRNARKKASASRTSFVPPFSCALSRMKHRRSNLPWRPSSPVFSPCAFRRRPSLFDVPFPLIFWTVPPSTGEGPQRRPLLGRFPFPHRQILLA